MAHSLSVEGEREGGKVGAFHGPDTQMCLEPYLEEITKVAAWNGEVIQKRGKGNIQKLRSKEP